MESTPITMIYLLKIAVRKPGGSYKLFRVGALPFGAVGSVSILAHFELHFIYCFEGASFGAHRLL